MFLKRIARTIFGIYATVIFLITLILAFISYLFIFAFVDKEKAPFVAHAYISRNWSKIIFIFYGIKIDIKNAELLEEKQTYVFISNHRSQLDIPAYAVATKHTIRFLAKAELTRIPMMGYIIKRLYISVDRKDKAARAQSMENMNQSIRDGISVFICPEGTRNRGSEPLLPFHDGAFRLAIQAQVPLAILVIKNSGNLLSPLRPIELSPGTIICQWCKPLTTNGMTEDDLPILKEKAIKIMLDQLS
jgi:1-acyl-sn-glycerol-3-phosphate acyltransferase